MKKLIGLAIGLWVSLGVMAQETPDALVKKTTEEVLEIVKNDKEIQGGNARRAIELVGDRVLPHFNFNHMTALAVGKDWRKANPSQQKQLVNEFRNLLVRTYANALTSYKNQKVVYKPFKMAPEDAEVLVKTEILQPGSKPVQVDYSLEKIDNTWKVFDVSVAGISLVTNYRDQFAQEVRNGGIDGLIETISAKNKSLETTLAKSDKK